MPVRSPKTAKKSRKKSKKRASLGGRPQVRQGDEVQVTVEFPLIYYARLAAYVTHLKEKAIEEGDSVWEKSKKMLLLRLWQDSWESMPARLKRQIEDSDEFRRVMKKYQL